jgi:capsular exopolysaccharide synthesis family protein
MATIRDASTWEVAREDRQPAAGKELLRHMAEAPVLVEIEEATAASPLFVGIEERFRQIAARCFDTTRPMVSQSVAITSATGGEGASTTVIGVAIAAARNLGTDVLVIETNVLSPQLASDWNLPEHPGLGECLLGEAVLEDALLPTQASNVWLLPAGRAVRNPGPLFRSQRFPDLIATLRTRFRTIVMDLPPLLTSPHAAVIAQQADAVVLVVRAGHTHVNDAQAALKAVGDVPVRGVVLNGTRAWLPSWAARILGVSRFAIE